MRQQNIPALALCLGLCLASVARAQVELTGRALEDGKPVANAVVWLDAPNAPAARKQNRVVMDQRNLTFYPHVLAVRVGTTVDFPNNDRVFHNVFSFRNGKRFDLGLYPVGAVRQVKFSQAGLSRLFCNIHPNMGAYILAVDTPYFAVTDKRGAFRMSEVPAGKYTYHAWRAGGADLQGTVVVEAGKALEVSWQ